MEVISDKIFKTASFNTNVQNATTDQIDLLDASGLSFFIIDAGSSNAHAVHQVALQLSPDGVKWFTTSYKLTGVTCIDFIPMLGMKVRGTVIVAEGAASTSQMIIALN